METINSFSQDQMHVMLKDLYCGMVCRKINEAGLAPFLDCDPYEFALSLDMSFDEILAVPLNEWESVINKDLEEFASDVK